MNKWFCFDCERSFDSQGENPRCCCGYEPLASTYRGVEESLAEGIKTFEEERLEKQFFGRRL